MLDSPLFPYAFALLLAVPFLIFFRHFVVNYIKLKNAELKLLSLKRDSVERVQAYERLTLFLERLKPANIVQRFDAGLSPLEFVFLTRKMITEEFDYNASQQLFLPKNTWSRVVACKTDLLHLLQKTMENLSTESTLEDFKTIFLMNYMNDSDFIAETLDLLRRENLNLN